MKIFTSLIMAVAILTGCTSTNPGNDVSVSDQVAEQTTATAALSGEQVRSLIINNTLVGRSNNFPRLGPIDFWIYYAADGTAKDRLKFARGGKIDRASGHWRIADEERGLFCSTFSKRRKGSEVCSRVYVTNDQFRTVPAEPGQKGVTGRIVAGDQVQ